MILQALYELYGRLAADQAYCIAPPGFSRQKISFKVVLHPDGTLDNFDDARSPNKKGQMHSTSMQVPGDAKPSGSGINPCFLWDNQTYLLGREPEDKKEGFGKARFEAFRRRHLDVEASVDHPWFSAVCRFLEQWDPATIKGHALLEDVGTGFGVFQMAGERRMVHEAPEIIAWWKANREKNDDEVVGPCLVTKEDGPMARLHPKIKGVSGAQSSGASIVSFNDTAYESYGKSQSYNSPVGEEAAFRYGAALNALLTGPRSERHRIRIGDTTVVFWTDAGVVEHCLADVFNFGSNAVTEVQNASQRKKIERVLRAVREGTHYQEFGDAADAPFHILGLAPNAARLSVRFYHRSSVAELLERLHDHQRCLAIVREFTEPRGKRFPDPEFPAIWQILRETVRGGDEVPPLFGGGLARAIVEGVNYPEALFSAVIRRIRADRSINYFRAATLKAVLMRNHHVKVPEMLDTENPDVSYRLGRLFAALEKTQDDALNMLNAGIRDRYYSAASATPASVFPRLMRLYTHHLGKLVQGQRINREKIVQEIFDGIPAVLPAQLNLKAQGSFAIGYYHQRKAFFTKKDDTSAEG